MNNFYQLSSAWGLGRDRLNQEYNDAYWERHYTLAPDRVPSFLADVGAKKRIDQRHSEACREIRDIYIYITDIF